MQEAQRALKAKAGQRRFVGKAKRKKGAFRIAIKTLKLPPMGPKPPHRPCGAKTTPSPPVGPKPPHRPPWAKTTPSPLWGQTTPSPPWSQSHPIAPVGAKPSEGLWLGTVTVQQAVVGGKPAGGYPTAIGRGFPPRRRRHGQPWGARPLAGRRAAVAPGIHQGREPS